MDVDWEARPEGTRSCALRLARMLEGLAKAHRAFARWNKQAYPRAAANQPPWTMPPDVEELTRVFEKGRQYKDAPQGPGNADLISVTALKPAMLRLVAAWEPDCGNLVCRDYWRRLFGDQHYPMFRSGWMTYLAPQYASRVTPPPSAIVETVAGGGMLVLATEERFSMDNPGHLDAADAIQAALAPIQDMLPSGMSM